MFDTNVALDLPVSQPRGGSAALLALTMSRRQPVLLGISPGYSSVVRVLPTLVGGGQPQQPSPFEPPLNLLAMLYR